jgi:hypothetical protein
MAHRFPETSDFDAFVNYLDRKETIILQWRLSLIPQKEAELRLGVDGVQLHRWKRQLRTKMEEDIGRVAMMKHSHVLILAERFSGISIREAASISGGGKNYREGVFRFASAVKNAIG